MRASTVSLLHAAIAGGNTGVPGAAREAKDAGDPDVDSRQLAHHPARHDDGDDDDCEFLSGDDVHTDVRHIRVASGCDERARGYALRGRTESAGSTDFGRFVGSYWPARHSCELHGHGSPNYGCPFYMQATTERWRFN
jgi:hypothetical protein